MFIFGSHTIDTGGLDMAVRRAAGAGLRTVQLFTAIPTYYGDRTTIRPERISRFGEALAETGIRAEHILVHAAYVLSVATAEPDKYERAAAGLAKEMERSNLLGVGRICFHPGSASDGDPHAAAHRVGSAMTRALLSSDGPARLLVENTAGAGRTLGRSAGEVGAILSAIPDPLRPRAGYGLDTCHLYASGYDISESAQRVREILDEFEDAAGEPPSFFHLNDSEGALGSNRDRHALLGEGRIGIEPFRWLLADPRARDIPLVLETPQLITTIERDDPAPDPNDLAMAALLASLVA